MSFIESSYVTKYFSFRFFFLLPFENVKTNLGSLGCTKVFIGQFWPAGYSLQTCDLYKHSCPYIYKRWRQNFFPLWLAVIQIKLIFFFFFFKNNVYSPSSDYFSFFFFIYHFFFLFVVDFVIHLNETAKGLHVFPIPIPLITFQKQFVSIREDKNSLENVMEKLSHN